jgi:hypothetical protein
MPDGVGGVIKRTADRLAGHGKDIPGASTLFELFKEENLSIKLFMIPELDIIKNDPRIPSNIQSVPGTMSLHQLGWSSMKPTQLSLRTLSCFKCTPPMNCEHFSSGGGCMEYQEASHRDRNAQSSHG